VKHVTSGVSKKLTTLKQVDSLSTMSSYLWRVLLLRHKLSFKYLYYKKYEKAILSSSPVVCDQNSEYEIHILTCKKDALCALWSLKTFFHYSGLKTRLVIHDDGTLTDDVIQIFLSHFSGCDIIRKRDAAINMRQYLRDFEYCSRFRFGQKKDAKVSLKLFDFFFFSRTKRILSIDSDILFFSKPTEIVQNMTNNKGCFTSDYQNAYSVPVAELKNKLGIKLRSQVNTGVFYFPGFECYDLNFLDSIIKMIYEYRHPISFWIEQTCFALIFSNYKDVFERLPASYQISKNPITDETKSHHFVNDGSRTGFYTKGLAYLKNKDFLTQFNKTNFPG